MVCVVVGRSQIAGRRFHMGVWMLENHCVNSWSAAPAAFALSSAGSEPNAMIELASRGKRLRILASGFGFEGLSEVIQLAADRRATTSIVCRMRSSSWDAPRLEASGYREQ